jgi:hypothetical protein
MGPGVRREARLVCVCTNEFAQTLPSACGLLLTRVRPIEPSGSQVAHPRLGATDRGEYRHAAR